MAVFLLILGIILFIGLVVIHEFGHFIAARRNGVDVEEFGIGFPPRAWSKKTKSGFLFSLNWLPIGGFVKLKGEHDSDTEKGSFGAASLKAKVKIMLAGVGMNLLGAFVLFTAVAWIGMPKLIENQFSIKSDAHVARQQVLVSNVAKDSPAAKAGLKQSDRVLSVEDESGKRVALMSAHQLSDTTKAFAGQKVTLTYDRDGQRQTAKAQLLSEEQVAASQRTSKPKGYLGVTPADYTMTRYTWSAPVVAVGMMGQMTAATFQGLGTAIAAVFQGDGARASSQVSGPVGIVVLLKNGSLLGIEFILTIIGLISLTLAIMNVLPIPALDGGRLFLTLISRGLFRRPLSEEMEERINGYGFLALIGLVILITIVDVRRYF